MESHGIWRAQKNANPVSAFPNVLVYRYNPNSKKHVVGMASNINVKGTSNFYRGFSLTWPSSMQIYLNKRKFLHKKRDQLPQD